MGGKSLKTLRAVKDKEDGHHLAMWARGAQKEDSRGNAHQSTATHLASCLEKPTMDVMRKGDEVNEHLWGLPGV